MTVSIHGTRARYTGGCRCGECRAANRAYITARRRAAGIGPRRTGPQTGHGTETRYARWGCRCDACRAAHTAYQRALRHAKRNDQSQAVSS